MFRFRPQHMEALSRASVQSFEDRMVIHLGKFFSEQCDVLGELETREAIRYGIQRAAGYDIVSERSVCKFIDIMFAFGRNFDEDPKLPWAISILRVKSGNPNAKADRLYKAALSHLSAGLDSGG